MSAARRAELVKAQEPVAVILGCIDSRVPPEVIFDQRVGSLLTIRTAGQALSGVAAGSIEFGTNVLAVPLVVVLGHSQCGAVGAAVEPGQRSGHLGDVVAAVAERLDDALRLDPAQAVAENLAATVRALRGLGTLEYEGDPAHVVGALYDIRSAAVTVTDDAGLLKERSPGQSRTS
jgi:carbonic anhydrase